MFRPLFLLSFVFLAMAVRAQVVNLPPMRIMDVGGRPYIDNWKNEAEGTPYFKDGWGKGTVTLKSGKRYAGIDLQVDLYQQAVYFTYDQQARHFTEPVIECSIAYPDKKDTTTYLFRTGYPVSGARNESTLYQVLAEGPRYHLLSFISRRLTEKTGYGTGTRPVFQEEKQLYLFDPVQKLLLPADKKLDIEKLSASTPGCLNNKGSRPKNEGERVKLVKCWNGG
jgi:hypothetical protein